MKNGSAVKLFCYFSNGQEVPAKEYTANYQKVMERTAWWREARFGMFTLLLGICLKI